MDNNKNNSEECVPLFTDGASAAVLILDCF